MEKYLLTQTMKDIFDGTNQYRVDNDVDILVLNSVLSESAQRHANDMASIIDTNTGAVGHDGTDGSAPDGRIADAGYF